MSRASGEIIEHLSADAVAVSSAGLGVDGILYAYVYSPETAERTLASIVAAQLRVLDSGVSGLELSDDGRFLAVSFPTRHPAGSDTTN